MSSSADTPHPPVTLPGRFLSLMADSTHVPPRVFRRLHTLTRRHRTPIELCSRMHNRVRNILVRICAVSEVQKVNGLCNFDVLATDLHRTALLSSPGRNVAHKIKRLAHALTRALLVAAFCSSLVGCAFVGDLIFSDFGPDFEGLAEIGKNIGSIAEAAVAAGRSLEHLDRSMESIGKLAIELDRTLPFGRKNTVSGYCEKFARKYCEDNAAVYEEGSARTEKRPDPMMRIENVFQPPDSRFTAGYDCRFQARRKGEGVREFSVSVLLTGTLHFAEHTKWKELQIVPIEYVADETNDRAGYGVFKYMKGP